jgi:hypothetical protein
VVRHIFKACPVWIYTQSYKHQRIIYRRFDWWNVFYHMTCSELSNQRFDWLVFLRSKFVNMFQPGFNEINEVHFTRTKRLYLYHEQNT